MAQRVAALLLAAGRSRRMGRSKQLLPLGDKPVIRHCVDALVAAGLQDIVVVVGDPHDGIADALHDAPVTFVRNDEPDSQMADSVRLGLRALDDRYATVLVCLSDHPLISAETVKAVIGIHDRAPGKIIIPEYGGKRGHPSLFPREILSELFSGGTLRDVVTKDEGRVLLHNVPDEGVVLDMDSPEDYQRILDKFQNLQPHHRSSRVPPGRGFTPS